MSVRFCCFCERELDRKQVTGNDFAKIHPCGCYSCPKCIFAHCCNRKSKTSTCPFHKTNIEDVAFVESSRDKVDDATKCELEKFKLDEDKEPGRCFVDQYIKNPVEMQNKLFLNLVFVKKPRTHTLLINSK